MSDIDLDVLSHKSKEQMENQWNTIMHKYRPVFIDLQCKFLGTGKAFFFLIAHIIKDIIKDLEIDYTIESEVLNLKVRRVFENLLVLYWINRHTPKESYVQLALEQITFCQQLKESQGLAIVAVRVLNEQIDIALEGAATLGITNLHARQLKRINFKHEAEKAGLVSIYNSLYNISSVLLHGGLFSTKFRAEQPSTTIYKNMFFEHLLTIVPHIETQLEIIEKIQDAYE